MNLGPDPSNGVVELVMAHPSGTIEHEGRTAIARFGPGRSPAWPGPRRRPLLVVTTS